MPGTAAKIKAHHTTLYVQDWLHHTQSAKVLHLFHQACNLVDEAGSVVSIVATEVGPGPFNLVTDTPPGGFLNWLDQSVSVQFTGNCLRLGRLEIDLENTVVWNAGPLWQPARIGSDLRWLRQTLVTRGRIESLFLSATSSLPVIPEALDKLRAGILGKQAVLCASAGEMLAGLGPGLTPAGDDFLIGVIYAIYAIMPRSDATHLTGAIAAAAIPRTTHLSGAWLRAAALGQANHAWKQLLTCLSADSDQRAARQAADRILASGYSSGTDALAGFIWGAQVNREIETAA